MPGVDVGGLLRSVVAATCVAAGVLHLSAAADHRGMGGHVAFFVLVAAAQSALGAAVLWTRRPGRWLAAAAAANLAVVIVWAVSRTAGLPVDGNSTAEAMGFKDTISSLFELGAVAGAGMWWLLPEPARQLPLASRRLASAMLGTGVWVFGASGLLAGHTHSAGHTHTGGHGHGTAGAQAPAQAGSAGHSHGANGPGAEAAHASVPARHADHAHAADVVATELTAAAHQHSGSAALATSEHGAHHHTPASRAAASSVPGPGPDVHDHGHEVREPAPVTAGSGEGHDHEGSHGQGHGSGGDDQQGHDDHHGHPDDGEESPGSPLDDVLKLLQPR